MKVATSQHKVLSPGEGLRLQSGPGRDLIFKVTGEDTGGAFDYFIVEVAPHGGPPPHQHPTQEETIRVTKGVSNISSGQEIFRFEVWGFSHLPAHVPPFVLDLTA